MLRNQETRRARSTLLLTVLKDGVSVAGGVR